ncbi:hypothetical protein [Pseudonocardia sp. NPDC049154]|uniref:hypothetical protein n=1 Tax=Pseudonocardia sp. NPDC049154 TaxID=3155501 RepID=UPI0033C6CFC1
MARIISADRIAIRVDQHTLLAVPPMHPATPSPIRVKVFELVLRRQFGEACQVATEWNDHITGDAGPRARLASLMSQTPHKNARGAERMAA